MYPPSFTPHPENHTVHHHRVITLWVGLRPDELKRQLNHLSNKVKLAFHNGHRPIRCGKVVLKFIHFPGKKQRYGLGVLVHTFRNGGGFTVSTLVAELAEAKTRLLPTLQLLGVTDPEKHAQNFQTIH